MQGPVRQLFQLLLDTSEEVVEEAPAVVRHPRRPRPLLGKPILNLRCIALHAPKWYNPVNQSRDAICVPMLCTGGVLPLVPSVPLSNVL